MLQNIITKKSFEKIGLGLTMFLIFNLTVLAQGSSPTARTPGTPLGSYQLGDFDNVNLFTGNLNFNLPLLNVGGRGEVGQSLGVVIEGQWAGTETQTHSNPDLFTHQWNHRSPNPLALVGSMRIDSSLNVDVHAACTSNPVIYWVTHQMNLTFVEPDGTEHILVDGTYHGKSYRYCGQMQTNYGKLFKSRSGNFMTFVADNDIWTNSLSYSGYLFFKNGTKYRIVDGQIMWAIDRNGNKINYTYENNAYKRLIKITDSIGREVNIDYAANEPAPYGSCIKITYDGFGGGEQNKKAIRINYVSNLTDSLRTTQSYDSTTLPEIEEDIPNDNIAVDGDEYIPTLIKSVWLPDGRKYEFKYNVLRQLARVELPTGGAVEYDYRDIFEIPFMGGTTWGANGIGPGTNQVTEKRVYESGNVLVNKTKFSVPTSYTSGVFPTLTRGNGTVRDVEQFDASGNRLTKSRHYFYGTAGADYIFNVPWWHGKELRTEIFDTNGTSILRVSERDWRQRIPSWCYNNPYVSTVCGPTSSQYGETMPTVNPFVVETKETIVDGNLVTKTSGINPNNGSWAFDDYNNQTDVWQYDFGSGQPGALIKHTQKSFYNHPSEFQGLLILGLPNVTSVYAVDSYGNETLASSSQIVYDEYSQYPLLTYSSVIGWEAPSNTFNIRGNATTVKQWLNTNNSWITTHTQFDQFGNSRKSWDALGRVSEAIYTDAFADSTNRNTYAFVTQSISPIPDPNNTHGHSSDEAFVSNTVYDYYSGLVKSTTDINGQTTNFEYNDPLNRLKKVISPNGAWMEYEYGDTIGNLFVKTSSTFDETRILQSYNFFDSLGRSVRSAKLDGEATWITVDTQYDALGRTWRVSNPYHASGLTGAVNPPNIWTTNQFDALSRIIKVTAQDGAESITTYFGNTVTGQDPAQKKRKSVTDALGRMTQIIEDPNGLNLTTYYKYDVLGNLRVVEQGQQRRYFMYDSLSRLFRSKNPEQSANTNLTVYDPISDNNQWSNGYEYAGNGNMLAKVDARGVRIEYSYDDLNRLYKRHYVATQTLPAGTYTTSPDDEYFYDGRGLTNVPDFALGKMTKAYSTLSETRYTEFDLMGRILVSEQETGGQTYQTRYKYNLSGALVSQIYPSLREVKNFFDNSGDLWQVSGRKPTAPYKMYVGSIDHDFTNTGAQNQAQLGNGRWESTVLNKRMQTTQVALGTTQSGTNLLKLNYDYGTSNNGNVQNQTIEVTTIGNITGFVAAQNYTYDGLNRLSSAIETSSNTTIWQQTFGYDRYGNRTVNTNSNATTQALIGDNPEISEGNNQIEPRPGELYDYDAAGNLTKDKLGNLFAYDSDGKQTTFMPVGASQPSAYYYYDSDGRRVKKISGNETTIFVYNALGQMIAEYGINTPTPQNPTTSYLTTDNLGTPRINTDTYGNVSARHDYLPFGEEIIGIGGRTAAGYNSDSIRQKFTGYQRDTESGLDFAQARYYAPNAGRFTSVDPLMASAKSVNPQTLNRYTYVLNNPYRMVDPTGLEESPLDSETELAFGHLGNLVDSVEAERQAERDAAREEAERKRRGEPANQTQQQVSSENNQQGQAPQQSEASNENASTIQNGQNGQVSTLTVATPTTSVRYYPVRGATVADAIRNAQIPCNNGMSAACTRASYTYETQPPRRNRDGTYSTIGGTLRTNITIRLPRWAGYNRASEADKRRWDNAMGHLPNHENQHRDIFVAGANEIAAAIPTTARTAAAVLKEENRKFLRAIDTVQQRSDQLDVDTDFGRRP